MLARTKTRTNPVFRPDELALLIGPERAERARTDPDSVDFLLWNVFSTLETHSDPRYLAYRLEPFGGPRMSGPLRVAMWTGANREPLLRPSGHYLERIKARARLHGGDAAALKQFREPIEVPVRIEAPEVLCLLDASTGTGLRGHGGRDRFEELIDAGLDHARRLGKTLAVGVIYRRGTPTGQELQRRLGELRGSNGLASALSYRAEVPEVVLRDATWDQVLRLWVEEREYLDLEGLPVRKFLDHCSERGWL